MTLKFTFWLDVCLLLAFAALQTVPFTGLVLHEWLGLGVVAMIVVHLLISWTWIASNARRFFTTSTRTRVNYAVNLTLFACTTALIFSGVEISREAIPALLRAPAPPVVDYGWDVIHDRLSDAVLILAGLHLAINWDWSLTAARKIFRRA
ncbi:MAG TPA: DUF4405 domain-containing protein [Bryobacteraceae bacterium]|nr:DUF4405 domain-containing protein [Bryobacteraceae bacterium]